MTDSYGAPALETFANPDDVGEGAASQLHASLGERLGAQAGEAFMGGTRTVLRGLQYLSETGIQPPAEFGGLDAATAAEIERRHPTSEISIGDAKDRVKQEGLEGHIKLPDQVSITKPVLDLMISHAHERRQYEAAVTRGPQGFFPGALGFLTEIGAGIVDPVNMAAFSIPVIGEARFGKMMLSAGESLAARAGVRAVTGAAQGAVGTALLQPADWWLRTRDGQDYTMADALRSVILGAGMGAAAHAGFGAIGDWRGHPAEVFADLPPRAREDVVRAAMADAIQGNAGRAGEVLEEAARGSPRIAEAVEGPRIVAAPVAPEAVAPSIKTGKPEVDAILSDPETAAAIAAPKVNRTGDVPYTAGPDKEGAGLNLDKHLPAQLTTKSGKTFDPAQPYATHEFTERDVMKKLIAGGMDQDAAYKVAHWEYAEPAEDAWYRANGIDPKEAQEAAQPYIDQIQHEKLAKGEGNVPPELFKKPYPHDNVSAAAKESVPVPKPTAEEIAKAKEILAKTGNVSRETMSADKPDWQRIADAKRPDDQDLAEASKAAESVPEPASVDPDLRKGSAAIAKAVKEADDLLAELLPRLTEDERAVFEEALNKFDQDKAAQEQMIRDGAECLMGAI